MALEILLSLVLLYSIPFIFLGHVWICFRLYRGKKRSLRENPKKNINKYGNLHIIIASAFLSILVVIFGIAALFPPEISIVPFSGQRGSNFSISQQSMLITLTGSYPARFHFIYRNISRDNEAVTVVYFNAVRSPKDIVNYIFMPWRYPRFQHHHLVDGRISPEPRVVEVYFMPIDMDVRAMDDLSDKWFDGKREYGLLIWNGEI